MTVLDVGAGTGGFAAAFREWFGVRVLAVEPSAAMRALIPVAPVLIRNTFPGRGERDLRVRFFPETAESVSDYPSVERVEEAFGAAGFRRVALRSLPQESAPTLASYADGLRRERDTKLRALTDEAYARGLARIRAAAAANPGESAVSWMDLLVLR
ncbi:hypothetical protein SRB5_08740 [Streptomyces sp. RB5]|uniref:Methyltransferase n=1 Tax=Streptomyces smaragdinus TaxID=2585196 RepID=A0A7K0CBC4_9ACTN|nr:hypothetical protein [Streptomyces smaragdinus]MQY10761.1 hypothetical protein [Streptomyces smaragdinus]